MKIRVGSAPHVQMCVGHALSGYPFRESGARLIDWEAVASIGAVAHL